jgi:glycosyltransferase involved in cell wall biosynthesis
MSLELREALRKRWKSDIYAKTVLPALRGDVFELKDLPPTSRQNAIVYHSSYGEPQVTDTLLRRSEQLVISYHNLTPPEHFMAWDAELARGVEWGRYELGLLLDRTVLAIADSTFNADDLTRYGYTDITVLPAGIRPGRLRSLPTDLRLAQELTDRFPSGFVVVVAQLLPHKRIERLIEAVHLVRAAHEIDLGLVVVGNRRLPEYAAALERHAAWLHVDRRWFTGTLTDEQLATVIRRADALVSASDHEGLSLPPLEAMAMGIPTIVRGAGAVPETVGNGAIVLPQDAGPTLFAEAIVSATRDERIRAVLVHRGLERVEVIAAARPADKLAQLIEALA